VITTVNIGAFLSPDLNGFKVFFNQYFSQYYHLLLLTTMWHVQQKCCYFMGFRMVLLCMHFL